MYDFLTVLNRNSHNKHSAVALEFGAVDELELGVTCPTKVKEGWVLQPQLYSEKVH